MKPLLIATGNRHKTSEIALMLGTIYQVGDLSSYPSYPSVVEDGTTFEENAALKAEAISRVHPGLVLADDSGLEVDFLNGEPGVRSARYAGEGATDLDNLGLLLERLEGVPAEGRRARFQCVMVVAEGGQRLAVFSGKCEGRLLAEPRGVDGFGYDPIFVPEGEEKTFAELPVSRKNELSHRGKALALAKEWLMER